MIKIAICDDEGFFLDAAAEQMKKYIPDNKDTPLIYIEKYTSSKKLKEDIFDNHQHDIYFLDVEMPELGGMELATEIRKLIPSAVIVFLTSHDNFASQGYLVGAYRYISKSDMANQLSEALPKIMGHISSLADRSIIISHYSNSTRLMYKDIVHVHRALRKLFIQTTSTEQVLDSRGLKELFELLADQRFVFIERSQFVNLDYVRRIDGTSLYLKNGETLIASRKFLPNVKWAIAHLWG